MRNIFKAAIMLCIVGVSIVSCKKSEDTANDLNNLLNQGQPDMSMGGFTCELDGVKFELIVTSTNSVGSGVSASTQLGNDSEAKYESYVTDIFAGKSGSVRIGKIEFSGGYLGNSTFKSFFDTGSRNYSVDAEDGVEVIVYINGIEWSSSNGTANQTGSTFFINSVTESSTPLVYSVKIEATFSCTLYDDSGNSKRLTNGKYVGNYENI